MRTPTDVEQAWLPTISDDDDRELAERVLQMEGGSQAVAYVAVRQARFERRIEDKLEALGRSWWSVPLKGVAGLAATLTAAYAGWRSGLGQ